MPKSYRTRLQRGVQAAQQLVYRDYRRSGLSYRAAAKQAGMKKQALYSFVTCHYKRWPRPENMRLLADAKWVGRWSRTCLHKLCDFIDGGGPSVAT
jgi:lambda repressor-like predicted transcriptional regulator